MHIRWDELQTVEAVVRCGSVEAAGRELGLQHSSVSRRLAALERRLGTPLFVRGGRLVPTALTSRIASHAGAMRAEALEISRLVTVEVRHRAARLVITSSEALAPLLFLALAETHSELGIDVRLEDAELALAPGEVDLALRPTQSPDGSLRGSRLGTLRLGIYRAEGGAETWILPSAELREKSSMRWWRELPGDASPSLTCNSLLGMRDACRAGLGRALLPSYLAVRDPHLRLERVVSGGTPLWLLSPAGVRPGPEAREAQKALRAALRSLEGVFTS